MTKRLVYITTAACSANTFLNGQLADLRKRGFKITVISAPGEELRLLRGREGVATMAVPMEREISPFNDLISLFRLYTVLRRLRPGIVNAGTPKAGLLGMIAAAAAGVPARVYTVHGLRLETTRGFKRRLLGWSERCASAFAHRVLCVSRSLRELYLEHGFAPASKTCLLGHGSANGLDARVPQDRHAAPARALRERLGIPDGAPVIGFVARFTRDKGVVELAAAFREILAALPAARLLMLGTFEQGDPIPPTCQEWLASQPQVIMPGFVNDPASYYPLMDVLAFPSYREGFPTVVLEAAAAEVPTAAFRATGSVDAVQDGVTGTIVPPADAGLLAQALLRYLTDAALRRQHGEAARKRVLRDFRPEDLWEALAGEYVWLLEARKRPAAQGAWSWRAKRFADLAFTVTALFLLLPLFAILWVAVRVKLGAPAIFRQTRPGLHGRPFTMVKFRTMTDARGPDGQLLPDEARLTPFGQALRRTSLDELPELFNVLKGEMSLVGPRPLMMQYLDRYTPEQRRRHEALPGITGLAQVSGRNNLSWEKKFALDTWYVGNRSLLLDFKILAMTVWKVLAREGVSAPEHLSAPEFMGSHAKAAHTEAAHTKVS